MPGPLERKHRARSALKAIVFVTLWGLLTHGTHAGTGDEPHYLAITHSIAFDGDLDLSNNYGANEPLVGGGVLAPEAHVRPGVGGIARPVHDIGLPLLFAPYVVVAVPVTNTLTRVVPPHLMQRARLNRAVLYRHLISLAMIVLTVALAGMLFDTFVELGGSPGAAFAASLLLTLSPPLLIFSILFFTELVSALLCLLVFRHVWMLDTRGTAAWALLGLATGFLFLLHAKNIGLIVPLSLLALYALRAGDRRREAAAFGIGLALMLTARAAVNDIFWDSLLSGPHARFTGWTGLSGTLGEIGIRIAGLLVDREFGLLPYAPIYLAAIAGAIVLLRTRRDLALPVLLVAVVYLSLIVCPLTNVHGWTGGWNPAARFVTPIVPLLGILVFAGLRAAPGPIAVILVAVQIVISAYAWQHPKILWNDGDGRAAFCETRRAAICRYVPTLVRAPDVAPDR
jgi:hypothetical protein